MIGFTGVVWFPRGATRMSLELYAGPGPVPLGAASASWGVLAGQLTEASVVLAGAAAALAAGETGYGAQWAGTGCARTVARPAVETLAALAP